MCLDQSGRKKKKNKYKEEKQKANKIAIFKKQSVNMKVEGED